MSSRCVDCTQSFTQLLRLLSEAQVLGSILCPYSCGLLIKNTLNTFFMGFLCVRDKIIINLQFMEHLKSKYRSLLSLPLFYKIETPKCSLFDTF